jgi:hypothetical protein
MAEIDDNFVDAQDENLAGEGPSTSAPGTLAGRTPIVLDPIQQNAEILQELQMKSLAGMSKVQLKDYSEQLKLRMDIDENLRALSKRKRTESIATTTLAAAEPDPERREKGVDNLIKRGRIRELEQPSQSAFQEWLADCEREFKLHGCEFDDTERRTQFAIRSISGKKNDKLREVIAALNRRTNRQGEGPLLWDEMTEIVQNTILNPAVRRAEIAVKYHQAQVLPNQSVQNFHKYMTELETMLDYKVPEGPAKVDSYFARLPPYIRARITEANVLGQTHTIEELMATAMRYEQANTVKASQVSSSTGSSPAPTRSDSGQSARGNRNRRGNRGGRGRPQGDDRNPASSPNNIPARESRPVGNAYPNAYAANAQQEK